MRPSVTPPPVSVVVPTYERRDYVRLAVDSVLAQTFADFELIVVDDGSTDGTERALRDLDPRLRYERQENRGPAAARNAGLALARGEIVAFLDSDNRWLPEHLAVVTELLARFPEAVLATTCPGFAARGRAPVSRAELVDVLPRLLLVNRVGWTSGAAIRSEALRRVGGYDERLPVFEDTDLWIRLATTGPFCLLRRRTIVHQTTRGGLKQRGVRAGLYPEAMRISHATARELLRSSGRPDAADLAARLDGKELLVSALAAFARRDEGSGRRLLAEACSRLPALSHEPEVVIAALQLMPVPRREAALVVEALAAAWPDRVADTPRYLSGYGAVRALGGRRLRSALRQAVRAGGWLRPRFLARTAPVSATLVRGWLHEKAARGIETGQPAA